MSEVPIPYAMREPCCLCGGRDGRLETRGNQDGVWCLCGKFQYNAPREETGRKQRSLSSRPGISPSVRARIFERYSHACIACGRRPPEVVLALEHLVSRELAEACGQLDGLIDSEWNYAVLCEECNIGIRYLGRPQIQLMYRAFLISSKQV